MVDYVVVGGGIAGTTAADAIRKRDPEGSVTILTDEAYPLWSKIRLPELFSGSVDVEGLLIRKPQWYERRNIDLRTEEAVTEVDVEARIVHTSKGAELPFDRLLLATGGTAYVPPIPGADLPNVHTIRKLGEAIAVKEAVTGAGRLVIIGGGTLGLEVARNILEAVGEVHVVESHERLLPRLVDRAASEMLHLRLDRMGIRVHHKCETREIVGDDRAETVLLDDGRDLPCDAVIIAAGMRAAKSLAVEMGLPVNKGIVVDDHLETPIRGVFAAGDVAEHRATKYGIWRAAEEQGAIAGANMAGAGIEYHGTVRSNYVRVAGADVFSAGDFDPEGQLESIVHVDVEGMVYKKLVLEDCRIVGSVMVGELGDAQRTLRAIETGIDVCPHKDDLRKWDLAFVPRLVIGRD